MQDLFISLLSTHGHMMLGCNNRIHWLPEEVPLADDVSDWNHKLNKQEKNLLSQIFRFFTQSDIS